MATNTWSSSSNTDWNTDANWSLGTKPTSSDDVVFDATSVVNCTLSANSAAKTITQSALYTGTLAIGTYDMAVTGDCSFAGKITMGISAANGLTAVNLTIGAGGIVTANGTYYNQVTVSGTLSPDSTGTYTYAGSYNGLPYYRRGSDNYYIWYMPDYLSWYLTYNLGAIDANPRWGRSTLTGAWTSVANGATGTATVANVTASGFIPSKVTISGNYDQSSITSKFLAYGSLITVNGNGTFTADGTLDSTQYNAASLVLNGTNTLTYGNNSDNSANGFGYLTTGQSGNTTTLASYLAVVTQLSVGTGTLTGSSYSIQLKGSTPLNLNASATISLLRLKFWGANQTIPSLTNGYGCSIILENGSIVTQTGNVVLNSGKYLSIFTDGVTNQVATWKTDGYNLTVGDYIQIGAGNDSGLKKLDATRNGARTSTITVGGNWLNYGTGSAPSQFVADNSTVVFNKGSGTQTVRSGTTNSPFYNLTHSGAGTLQLSDNCTVTNIWNNGATAPAWATPAQADITGLKITDSPQFANLKLTGGGGIYPSADSTTALYINKADNATHIVTIDTTNARVGIGTTNPQARLDVTANSTSVAFFTNTGASSTFGGAGMIGYSDDGAALASGDRLGFLFFGGAQDAAHTLINSCGIQGRTTEAFSSGHNGSMVEILGTPTGSASRATWATFAEGELGIGLAPTAVLTLKAGTATANTAPLKFTAGVLTTAIEAGTIEYTTGLFQIRGDALQIQSPTEVAGNPVVFKLMSNSATNGNGVAMDFIGSTAVGGIVARIAGIRTGAGGIGDLALYTSPASGAPVERMRILSTGQVGIGTTVPGKMLSVGANLWQADVNGIQWNNGAITTTNGVTGTAKWSQPFQGSAYKKVVINLANFTSAGTVLTFPVAFTNTPYTYGDAAAIAIAVVTTTTVTLTAVGAVAGLIFIEGY